MSSTEILTWRPTPDEVARLLRARTKDASGVEVGEWTAETRPTLDEVEGLIDQACDLILARTGVVIGEPCEGSAQAAAGLLAAMLVELSYFPEQVRSDRSAYQEYERLLNAAMTGLAECIAAGGGGDVTGEGFTYHSLPVIPVTTFRRYGGYPPGLGGDA